MSTVRPGLEVAPLLAFLYFYLTFLAHRLWKASWRNAFIYSIIFAPLVGLLTLFSSPYWKDSYPRLPDAEYVLINSVAWIPLLPIIYLVCGWILRHQGGLLPGQQWEQADRIAEEAKNRRIRNARTPVDRFLAIHYSLVILLFFLGPIIIFVLMTCATRILIGHPADVAEGVPTAFVGGLFLWLVFRRRHSPRGSSFQLALLHGISLLGLGTLVAIGKVDVVVC